MSCSDPNAQQFEEAILALILPNYANYSIISTDASQIEKRLVLHYIQNRAAIERYQADPDTDSYELTAELCGIGRRPAKTLDLATGYGAGKKKVISQLRSDPSIIAAVREEVYAMNLNDELAEIEAIERLCTARGEQMYNAYHHANPTLKETMKEAEAAVKSRDLGCALDSNHRYGYVTNLYGRDRHIPYARYRTDFKTTDPFDRAWLAFSTLNQSSAADLFKERFVALMETIGGKPIYPIGVVHDSIVLVAPTEYARDARFRRDVVGILESPAVQIDVPIRWSIGVSERNWLEASTKVKDGGDAAMVQYDKDDCTYFNWIER
jgi:DNA polymerase I-like protein with 3'-5' exonuclease and polymerase domains